MRTVVVIPTYLEAENITLTLERVRDAAPSFDVLVVDDSSEDGTADLVRESAARLGSIELLVRPKKEGLGYAYRAGFSEALAQGYDIVCQMDADLSHDPADLVTLVAQIASGADLAIGSRYVAGGSIPHWPWHRRALSKWGNRYAGAALGSPARDATSGYRAFRSSMLREVRYDTTLMSGYGFQIELAYRVHRAGGHIAEVPIAFTDRERGHSKMSFSIAAEQLWRVSWWGLRDRILRRPDAWS